MAKAIPKFTYTGSYETSSDNTYWYIKLKSSGTFRFTSSKTVDIALVGGGGSSACLRQSQNPAGGSGGGGGYITTASSYSMNARYNYIVTIGAGGSAPGTWTDGNAGGTTNIYQSGGSTSTLRSAAGGKGCSKMGWKSSGTPGAGTGAASYHG